MKDWQQLLVKSFQKEMSDTDVDLLFGVGQLSSTEALDYYRGSYRKSRKESLNRKFSKTRSVLGKDEFDRVAELFLNEIDSTHYSIDDYGEELPDFFEKHATKKNIVALCRFEENLESMIKKVLFIPRNGENFLPEKPLKAQNYQLYTSEFNILALWNSKDTPSSKSQFCYVLWYEEGLQKFEEVELWEYSLLKGFQQEAKTLEKHIEDIESKSIEPVSFQNFFTKLIQRNLISN